MAKPHTILVACGTAIATSTVVAKAIEEACKAAGLNVVTRQVKSMEVMSHVKDADLIVTTTPISGKVDVPVIMGLAFLTGVGKDKVLEDIISKLKAMDAS